MPLNVVCCSINRSTFVSSLSRLKDVNKSGLFIILCLLSVVSFVPIFDYRPWRKASSEAESKVNPITKSIFNEKLINIAIWISPETDDPNYRHNLVESMIVEPQNTESTCFHKHQCNMTMSEENLEEADAILFFMFNWNIQLENLPPSWQSWRRQDQIWAIHADEAPISVANYGIVPPVFNWSISYRRDSEIWWTYGRQVPLIPPIPKNRKLRINGIVPLSKWISGKSKLVAGVISHCDTPSKREFIVQLLQNTGKPVDIYGGCGNFSVKCGFYSGNCSQFWEYLAQTYKFYLAFENALCEDYITEKFWRALGLGMVPVVYGGANYTQLAPPGSYIDANEFDSAEELMEFLEEVGGNASKYATYFDWRRNYKLVDTGSRYFEGNHQAWCQLCQKLHAFKNNFKSASKRTIISQLPSNWWMRMPKNSTGYYACKPPENFTLKKWELSEDQVTKRTEYVKGMQNESHV